MLILTASKNFVLLPMNTKPYNCKSSKNIPINTLLLLFVFVSSNLFAQTKTDSAKGNWTISGYADVYFSGNKSDEHKQKISNFQFNHNRYNQPALNLAYLGIAHESNSFRMEMTVHAGTYVHDNYAAESGFFRNINKAYAGVLLNKKRSMWLDVGIFPSFIGFESAVSFDNLTLTRSLLAENSPYFLSGIRLHQKLNDNNELNTYLLTGWQRITMLKGNSLPSIGFQWLHFFNESTKFNWSFFAGTDQPDANRKMRYFNNFYYQSTKKKFAYTLGFDLGFEQKMKGASSNNYWLSPVLIAQYTLHDQLKLAGRIEKYNDPSSVITRGANNQVLNANGISFNLDYAPTKSLLLRAEWRKLSASNNVFQIKSGTTNNINYFIISASYKFNYLLK